jgi:D-3-phosphoglycerate dehydrogenase / 2-oxoglutarate reductase
MKVLVTDKINEIAKNIIEEVCEVDLLPTMSEDELCKVINNYDALMVRSQTKVTSKVIEAGKNLKIIGRAGVGVDNIDVNSATENGIIVVNSPDGNTNAAAEHTIALMLAMSRNIPQAATSTKEGKWERSKFTGVEVFNKNLGVIGFGKIGSHVAQVAAALGMHLFIYDPFTTKEIVEKIGAKYIENLDDLWVECDFITVHVPKTKDTTHLINKNSINKMKKGVRIINCARGGIIDEIALKEALENGHVASCAIDVYEDEPNIQNSPLITVDKNIVLTPHLGASTDEAQLNVAIDVANQIKTVLLGGDATSAVNIPSLKPEKLNPVKDYMTLAENLGTLAQQISQNNLKSIEITVNGNLATVDVSPLEIAVLKGVFSSFSENVNYVNAPVLAKQKGISILTAKSEKSCDYIGSITVKLITNAGETIVSGALIAENIKRITKINQYEVSIEPHKHMLLVPHENKPCMIAKVATVIGNRNINIAHMHVAQSENDYSIMIINTDIEVKGEVLKEIADINGIKNAKYVHFNVN